MKSPLSGLRLLAAMIEVTTKRMAMKTIPSRKPLLVLPIVMAPVALALTGMAQPASPVTTGSVVHQVYQTTEQPRSEPPDPFHLPLAALTPPQRVTEQWTLVVSVAKLESPGVSR